MQTQAEITPGAPRPHELSEIRLLAEAGFLADARWEAAQRGDGEPDRLSLRAQLAHRAGEISEALTCWRELHQQNPHAETAVLRLAALREEEGRSIPGRPTHPDLPYVRKALRHVVEGQLERALATCVEGNKMALAAGDGEQRKLLTLLEALVHELGGRLDAAVATLERMGREPAFAHDLDRLALLARICERAGDRAGLISAERVLHFLASSGKLSAYDRLIQVRQMLGDGAGVEQAQAAYEVAFVRRMQWLQPKERLAALPGRYVPRARLAHRELPPIEEAEDSIERGILLWVQGRLDEAERHLVAGPLPWRAALALDAGRVEETLALATAAIEARGVLDAPLAWLLADALAAHERAFPKRAPPEGGAAALSLARSALRRGLASGPVDTDLLERLIVIEGARGDDEEVERLRERLRLVREHPWPPPGVVRAAAVYGMPGKVKGLVHDIVARRRPAARGEGGRLIDAELHGNFAPGTKQLVRRTFAAVREWLLVCRPELRDTVESFTYGLHVTKEDEPSGGPSIGLPVGIAFASAMSGRSVPQEFVFTGALSYDGIGKIAILPVGEIGPKLKGVLHCGARWLVLPSSQRDEALLGAFVPPAIAERSIHLVASFAEAWELVENPHSAIRPPGPARERS